MKDKFYKEFLADFENGLEDEDLTHFPELKMGYVPFLIRRIKDGRLLQLKEDEIHYDFNDKLSQVKHNCTFGRLFFDPLYKGNFEILAWCHYENVKKLRKSLEYRDRMIMFV